MKKTILYTLIAVAVAASAVGCSTYSKLLKSEDYEAQYKAALQYLEDGKYQKAITLFEKVNMPFMNSSKSDSIMFYTGLALYKMGDFESSGMVFDQFRSMFQRSPFLEEAEYMYAMGFYYSAPEPDRDQAPTREALMAIDTYLQRYPNSPKKDDMEENIKELMQKLYDKEFLNARTYYKIGAYRSAVVALKNALDVYPETPHREELLYLIAKSSYEYASNSMPHVRRDRYLTMMDDYLSYLAEYPEGEYVKELTKMYEEAREYIARSNEGEIIEVIE